MRLFSRLRGLIRRVGSVLSGDLVTFLGGGSSTDAGITVNANTALSSSAVLCAIRNISESLAMLPSKVNEHDSKDRRKLKPAFGFSLFKVLKFKPNDEITIFDFMRWLMVSLLTRGNFYAQIVRDGGGRVRELWPLHASEMRVERNKQTKALEYHYLHDGIIHILPPDEVFRVIGFFTGGLVGLALSDVGKNQIGNAIAGDRLAGAFFKNGNTPSAVLESPVGAPSINPTGQEEILKSLETRHGGLSKQFRLAILQEGLEWKTISMNPAETQLIESRTFQIGEVARVFNIQLHKLKELTHATFSNIEHLGIEFVTDCLGPWIVNIEQRFALHLMSDSEWERYKIGFNLNALLRTDVKTQSEVFVAERNAGILTANEIREFKGLNPREDEAGDWHLRALNML